MADSVRVDFAEKQLFRWTFERKPLSPAAMLTMPINRWLPIDRTVLLWVVLGMELLATLLLRLWSAEPERFIRTARAIAVVTAVFVLLGPYFHCIRQWIDHRPCTQFSLRGVMLLATAAAVVCAAGFPADVLVLLTFVIYTCAIVSSCATVGGRYLKQPLMRGYSGVLLTSAITTASFVFLMTAAASGLVLSEVVEYDQLPVSTQVVLVPAALIAWLFILGDNARSDIELLQRGLPLGLLFNAVAGGLMGLLLTTGVFAIRYVDKVRVARHWIRGSSRLH